MTGSQRRTGDAGLVECFRSGALESSHRVHVVVCDASGRILASVGAPELPAFYRSAAKPFQALPLVEDGVVEALGLTGAELALACASHNSEPEQVETARSILRKAGLGEETLGCGGHPPIRAEEGVRLLMAGVRPGPIHSNCSGKHAGMLALAVHHGWPVQEYVRVGHPVQRRMKEEIRRWTGLEEHEIDVGVDGCGVACFRVPLRAMATSFARFADAARRHEAAGAIVEAMTGHPGMVAGRGRLCTAVMEATEGRVFAKTGAEGVYGAGIPERGWGVALKVEDGARRAADVAMLRVLDALEASGPRDALSRHREAVLRNTRGEVVGVVRAAFDVPAPEQR